MHGLVLIVALIVLVVIVKVIRGLSAGASRMSDFQPRRIDKPPAPDTPPSYMHQNPDGTFRIGPE